MKRIRVMGLCLAIVFAASAVAAATAAAELPEIGRCLRVEGVMQGKKTVYSGAYKNKACTKESPTKTGKFEWSEGPGESKLLEGAGGIGEPATFTTANGSTIACSTGFSDGEVTGAKTTKVTYTFLGCEDTALHETCQGLAPEEREIKPIEGEIKTLPLTGEVGFIQGGEKPKVGWDFKPMAGSIIAEFECGGPVIGATQVLFEGSFIGAYKPVDRMREETVLRFKSAGAKQIPEAFEGGTADTMTATFIAGLEKTTEAIGLSHKEELYSEEELEVKAKP